MVPRWTRSHTQIPPQHSIYWLTAYCYFRHVTPPNSRRLLRFRFVVVFHLSYLRPDRMNRNADGLERSQLRVWGVEVAQSVNSTGECVRTLYVSLTSWANRDGSQKCSLSSNRSCGPIYRRFVHSPQSVVSPRKPVWADPTAGHSFSIKRYF